MHRPPALDGGTSTQSDPAVPSLSCIASQCPIHLSEKTHARVLRDPDLEDLRDDRAARLVRVAQVQPVRERHGPPLVVHLVHELAVAGGDAEGGDAVDAVGLRGVQRLRVARPRAEGGEVCRGRVRGARGRRRRGERLVQALRAEEIGTTLESEGEASPTWSRSTLP